MKKLDKLLARSFVGPFIVTFGIALFVLLMQILWLYLDDIAGKGLSFFQIMELLAYKCVGLVPLALPLALLISSVMVLGGLAEHYELSSFKSAGVSLLRVMRPLIVFGIISAGVSYACADYLIPAANLQFGARMYAIQQKKPTLNMEPGVFNEDFDRFSIRLGDKADDGRAIQDVLIYDHTKANVGELSQITADDGEMYTVGGGAFFVMRLFDGHQYVEQRAGGSGGRSAPFLRTNFEEYTKVFDLSEFMMEEHAASMFASNRSMLSTRQLQVAVDSLSDDILIRKQGLSNHLLAYLPELPRDTVVYREATARTRDRLEYDMAVEDSLIMTGEDTLADGREPVPELPKAELPTSRSIERTARALNHPLVRGAAPWTGVSALIDSASQENRNRIYNRARSSIRSVTGQSNSAIDLLPGLREQRVKHVYDMHMKYSMAVVCIIFIFIGAPMGAIVRKGGFGYPILISIIFFVIFVILTIFCRKLAESFVVSGAMAGWLPCIILFPVSLWITYSAMKDAKLLDADRVKLAYRRARDSKRVAALRRAVAKR
jgi:lipopolysaccharide export system permease protein